MERVRCVQAIAMLFERLARRLQRLCRPAQVARHKRNLCFGDDAPRASHRLFRTKGTRGTFQQRLRADEIAELCHSDPPKRERGRIVTQGNALERTEWITCREGTRRCRDQ